MISKTMNRALWAAGLSLAVPAAVAVTHFDLLDMRRPAAATEQAEAPPPVPVTVETVKPKPLSVWQDFSGRLEAIERVDVRAQVAGAIRSVHFREGSLVKAGDLLVTIDPAAYEAAAEQAAGQVASAKARLDLTQSEIERGKALSASKTISKSELAQRQAARSEAAAALRSAEAALAAARINLDRTRVRAPISGRAGRLELTAGNLVAEGAGSPILTTLVSVDPIYASFDVAEDVIARLMQKIRSAKGSPVLDEVPVEVITTGGEQAPTRARLQMINNEVDQTSGTVRLRAVLDNPEGRLIPGQFVRIRLGEPGAKDRLSVSERAIGTDQDKKFVLLVGPSNVATYREVELGASVDGGRIVERGLSAGDRVLVGGLQRVRPGAVVAPQEKALAAQ